ncbi:MAG: hypothetical protein COZ59_02030 [Bacteroidetes bacterium CG_4_8_14_3_um_filter_31_14]|nr:MAG: hypothetical protein COZ59_02030 [Bacteroidetes bacterium CG_4_8_14_3_um_filter_31_14]
MDLSMLVDSGADCSLIPKSIGKEMGLNLADAETIQFAKSIGGVVKYVMRDFELTIDNHSCYAKISKRRRFHC